MTEKTSDTPKLPESAEGASASPVVDSTRDALIKALSAAEDQSLTPESVANIIFQQLPKSSLVRPAKEHVEWDVEPWVCGTADFIRGKGKHHVTDKPAEYTYSVDDYRKAAAIINSHAFENREAILQELSKLDSKLSQAIRPYVRFSTSKILSVRDHNRVMDHFQGFLQSFSRNKFLIDAEHPLIKVLEAAGSELKAQYGSGFIGLSLGESYAFDLAGEGSDVDYFVMISRDVPDRPAAKKLVEKTVNDHLKRSGFRPCNASSLHIYLTPIDHEDETDRDPYFPSGLDFFSSGNLVIMGDPARLEEESLRHIADNRAWRLKHQHGKLAWLGDRYFTPESFQTAAVEAYGKMMKFYPIQVADKLIKRRSGLFVPSSTVEKLKADRGFVDEVAALAKPYLEERAKNFPIPKQILDLLK